MIELEERVEALEDLFKETLASVAQVQAQNAMLAQVTGAALARACANNPNPAHVMEQLLQLFDDACLGTANLVERDELGLCDAQKQMVDVVRLSAEGTLDGILASWFQRGG
ncbi:hypothetical protein [Acetobacter indonesiensis]|uniref:Uncharacterized protein n=1 Tax=Acetobacter indonesiensis TaxID=104101 RepID=A0A252AXM8_9PROT|nr:hypothetical protein [Acetobacter indonesiensis]OUI96313.1 hypothetical protein HK17_11850 [Acetobacter indonesiensis]